ncbi:MAG: hypothetical protein ACRD3W_20455, partial [Terriglobales bacterium]
MPAADARLVNSPTDNYIAGMEYANFWPATRMPLKVYIHPGFGVAGFNPSYVDVFQESLRTWNAVTDNLVCFESTQNQAESNIEVEWAAALQPVKIEPGVRELGLCEMQMCEEGVEHASISLLTI